MYQSFSRRESERRPLVAAATITFFDEDTEIHCSTVNISHGGVKLILPRDIVLRPDFRVCVPSVQLRKRRSRMAWRFGDELGVVFV